MDSRHLLLPAALVVCAWSQAPPPDAAAREAMIARMRKAALDYSNRLRDFTCVQVTARSIGPTADGPRWKPLETQEQELNYVDHREHYRLLKVNGETTNLEKRVKSGYFKGHGEFGTALRNIFDPNVNAKFAWDHAESGACVFHYSVEQSASTIVIHADQDDVRVGHHGTVWADCESGVAERFVTETEPAAVRRIGRRVPIGYRLEVRYGPAAIGGQEFLLPQSAVNVALFYKTWTKAEIEFREYRKYDANSTVKFDAGENRPER